MHLKLMTGWRRWPLAAGILALLFIGYGISLVSRSRVVQARIAQEVRLLDALSKLGDELHRLGVVHRVVNVRG